MDRDADRKNSAELAAKTNGIAIEDADCGRIFEILRGAQMALGSRLHFLILSLCAGTPIVPVCTDPKVEAFSAEVFGSHALSVRRGESGESLLRRIEDFISENLGDFDETARKSVLSRLSARAEADALRISAFCTGISQEKCAKALEKSGRICYN